MTAAAPPAPQVHRRRRIRRPAEDDRRGFTLLELIVVVVVLAVLAGLAAFGYATFVEHSRREAVRITGAQVARTVAAQSATDRVGAADLVTAVAGGTRPGPWAADVDGAYDVAAAAPSATVATATAPATVTVTRWGYCVVAAFGNRIGEPGNLGQVDVAGSCAAPADGTGGTDGGTGGGSGGGSGGATGPEAPPSVSAKRGEKSATVDWTPADGASEYSVCVGAAYCQTASSGPVTLAVNPGNYPVKVTSIAADGTRGGTGEASVNVSGGVPSGVNTWTGTCGWGAPGFADYWGAPHHRYPDKYAYIYFRLVFAAKTAHPDTAQKWYHRPVYGKGGVYNTEYDELFAAGDTVLDPGVSSRTRTPTDPEYARWKAGEQIGIQIDGPGWNNSPTITGTTKQYHGVTDPANCRFWFGPKIWDDGGTGTGMDETYGDYTPRTP